MQQYIVNLTDNLIGTHRYAALSKLMKRERFFEHVKDELEQEDVRKMAPETLGRIMCSLEIGDVMLGKQELLGSLHFCGDCGDLLREAVSVALASVIRDRLDPIMPEMSGIPSYRRH